MVTSAPRIDRRLVDEIVRLDDGKVPIAEVCRRVGAYAAERGLTQPSYECVRELVHIVRTVQAADGPSRAALAWAEASRRSAYWAATDAAARMLTGRA